MPEPGTSFSFGENWKEFVDRYFDEERVSIARRHILEFLELPDLSGLYFLDIGCGSGLSSLAANEANAARVVSFDVDPRSVETTDYLKQSRGNPAHWQVLHGSILDVAFVTGIKPADVVYSWGVLHHTGAMWQAIENAATLLKDDGLLYIAIYTTTPKSPHWIDVKKRYNRVSRAGKRLMEWKYLVRHTVLPCLISRRNPLTFIRGYKRNRGMAYFTDVRDWLGGWPYEDAQIEEILRFCRKRLNLELVNLKTGEANTEYLFIRRR